MKNINQESLSMMKLIIDNAKRDITEESHPVFHEELRLLEEEYKENMGIFIQEMADKMEIPVKDWAGRCYEIATNLVAEGFIEGQSIYGQYHGFISDDCEMFAGRDFTHHGWIETEDSIIDPTRWVFENVEPYIYEGPKDDPDYDMGGNRVKKMFMTPAPAFDDTQRCVVPTGKVRAFAQMMLESDEDRVCSHQACWLASLPLDILGDMAKPVYEWMVSNDMDAFIPMDNRNYILGEDTE